MRQAEVAIALSRLKVFQDPDPGLEQYATPPEIAAAVANRIALSHDRSCTVVDLGCGTGMLSIAVAAYGFPVIGYDMDPDALKTARKNLERAEEDLNMDLAIALKESAVDSIDTDADLVVMNPPFGIQEEGQNLPFLATAFRTAPVIYALLHRSDRSTASTRQFIKDFASNHSFEAQVCESFEFALPASMSFHTDEHGTTKADLYRFEETTNGVRDR